MPQKKVLLVDDEHDLLEIFNTAVAELNSDLLLALSVQDAVHVLQVHDVGLIVCDNNLIREKGEKLLSYIIEKNLPIEFCYFTGDLNFTGPEGEERVEVFYKPIDTLKVLQKMKDYLNRKAEAEI